MNLVTLTKNRPKIIAGWFEIATEMGTEDAKWKKFHHYYFYYSCLLILISNCLSNIVDFNTDQNFGKIKWYEYDSIQSCRKELPIKSVYVNNKIIIVQMLIIS